MIEIYETIGKRQNKEIVLKDTSRIAQLKVMTASERVKQVFENVLYQVLFLAFQDTKIIVKAFIDKTHQETKLVLSLKY